MNYLSNIPTPVWTLIGSGVISLLVSWFVSKRTVDYEYERKSERQKKVWFDELYRQSKKVENRIEALEKSIENGSRPSELYKEYKEDLDSLKGMGPPIDLDHRQDIETILRKIDFQSQEYAEEIFENNLGYSSPKAKELLKDISSSIDDLKKLIEEKMEMSEKGSP